MLILLFRIAIGFFVLIGIATVVALIVAACVIAAQMRMDKIADELQDL